MDYRRISVGLDDGVATIVIKRPEVMNALDDVTLHELQQVTQEFATDELVRVVVLTGYGDKAFIAGADIKQLSTLTPIEAETLARRGQAVCNDLEQMGKPVIAAINGYALGGGCEIAMACTLRIASDSARIGQPEVTLGLIPGYGGTQRLTRLVGHGRALEIMLTGKPISAEEAWRIGLINRVVPSEELTGVVDELARNLSVQSPLAMKYILSAVRDGLGMTLRDGCSLEASLLGLMASTDDWREGTTAFIEKRRPRFTGS